MVLKREYLEHNRPEGEMDFVEEVDFLPWRLAEKKISCHLHRDLQGNAGCRLDDTHRRNGVPCVWLRDYQKQLIPGVNSMRLAH